MHTKQNALFEDSVGSLPLRIEGQTQVKSGVFDFKRKEMYYNSDFA